MTADLGPAATPRPIPTPEDRMRHARLAGNQADTDFGTYLDRQERDQLDARAATAEQERDDALDDRDEARASLRDAMAELRDRTAEARAARSDYEELVRFNADTARQRDEAVADRDRLTTALAQQIEETQEVATELAEARTELMQATRERDEALEARDVLRHQLDQLRPKLANLEAIRATYDAARDSLSRYRDAITAENAQWQAEIAHLRDLINQYGDDGMIPAAAVRKALRDGPPPGLGSPAARAQDEPGAWMNRRAVVSDALGRTLWHCGHVVPLSVRDRCAEAVLAALDGATPAEKAKG